MRSRMRHPSDLRKQDMPVGKNEDVEFSLEEADQDDLEALRRAEEADRRQE